MFSVIDIGCLEHGEEESVHALVERFRPDILFGFDTHPDLREGMELVDGVPVVRRRAAAWTHTGTVPVQIMGACTGVAIHGMRPYQNPSLAPCFDLCSLISSLPGRIVLKLDAEGSEYPLLNAISERGLDEQLELVLVEWHDGVYARGLNTPRPSLSCSVEEWERPSRGTPAGPTSKVVRSLA